MLSILQQFQTYLPKKWNGDFDSQILTGDQLTVERAVNVISSVANGENQEEQLSGLNLQIGDWHACVKLLTVSVIFSHSSLVPVNMNRLTLHGN